MQKKSEQNFLLVKKGIETPAYISAVLENEGSQTEFITTLDKHAFSSTELLELINTAENSKLKTLLIIQLLSQKDYLMRLKEESILNRLTNNELHRPSRLNTLVHQLDLSLLTLERIGKLAPEAAFSILCSVPHFHQLTLEQVRSLTDRYPHFTLLVYWLNHMALMPNAHFVMAHLAQLNPQLFTSVLGKLAVPLKESIISSIIQHLDLFETVTIPHDPNEEKHLILAIQLFHQRNQQHAYSEYINSLAAKLVNKNHPLSLSTIQQLLSLNGKPVFKELNDNIAYLTKFHLRALAKAGAVDLFYEEGQLNLASLVGTIPLNTVTPSTAPFLKNVDDEDNESLPQDDLTEHKLITELKNHEKPATVLDYFLIHFTHSTKHLKQLIMDFLGAYALEPKAPNRNQTLYHLLVLMNKSEFDTTTREILFQSFLQYPELFDETICYQLFQFDAQRTIQHFGKQGGRPNYLQVVTMCCYVLSKIGTFEALHPAHQTHQQLKTIAEAAKTEAEFELGLDETDSFWSNIVNTVKRRWNAGWNTYFSPQLPSYVSPVGYPALAVIMPAAIKYRIRNSLEVLLKDNEENYSINQLEEIITAYKQLSLLPLPPNETEIRLSLDNLLHHLIEQSPEDQQLMTWLKNNQQHFHCNHFRLAELHLANAQLYETKDFVEGLAAINNSFVQLNAELTCKLPTENPPAEPEPGLTVTAGQLLASATTVATNWASSIGGFFAKLPETKFVAALSSKTQPSAS